MRDVLLLTNDEKGWLQRLFEERGFYVRAATDAETGMRKLHLAKPDLVVSDDTISDIELNDFIEQTRAESNVPMIMLRRRQCDTVILKALLNGVDSYLPASIKPDELFARTEALLRRSVR